MKETAALKKLKKIFNQKTVFGFIFLTMVLSTIYVIVRMILAPTVADPDQIGVRIKGDYTLPLLQCLVGVLALMLPSFLAKRFKIIIPSGAIIAYAVFLYCAIYLGEVRSFYFRVPHWDVILHAFSGAMLAALGFALISVLNKKSSAYMSLSPLFVAIFAFCFAITAGVFWELYEFLADSVLGTNMQKFALADGTELVGHAALIDTMKDFIVNIAGALTFTIFGYISIKTKPHFYEKLILKKKSAAHN